MLFAPADYADARPYELLQSAARGHIAFDRRLWQALTADPKRTRPDLERFIGEDRSKDRVDHGLELMGLLCAIPIPETAAAEFLVSELRRFPDDAPEEMLQLAIKLKGAVATPLLDLFEESGRQNTEALFVALTAGASGPRIEAALNAVEADDPAEAEFLREIADNVYEDEAANTDLDPKVLLPEIAEPDLGILPEEERGLFLESPAPELRRLAASFYVGETLSDRRRQQMLALGSTDPDAGVRALAWEALREHTELKTVRDAMAGRLQVAEDPGERASIASALAYYADMPGVTEEIRAAYNRPETRAKAIEAMWRSLDRQWVSLPPLHLEDPDAEVRRQAILAAGYFQLRSEAPRLAKSMLDPDVRIEAINSYAIAAPAENTRFGMRQLEKRIEDLAGGLSDEEQEELRDAIETRLAMAGRPPVPAPDQTGSPTGVIPAKAGRNDPCPCGSGKKYKKCCGA